MTGRIVVRRITDADWERVGALESAAYVPLGLSEGTEALRSRARISPATCRVLDVGSHLAGYLVALPYPAHSAPDLGRPEEHPYASRNLHLHDLVVDRRFRRRGLGQRLLDHLTRTAGARGFEQLSLVAVGGSESFWALRGFTARPDTPPPGGYGPGAVYMTRAVPAASLGGPVPAGGPRARPYGPAPDEETG